MCLILSAGKGTNKQSEFFINAIKTAAKTNNDGFGIAVKRTNYAITYKKGFSTVESLLVFIKNLYIGDQDELIVHLRRISIGTGVAKNAHPFICDPTNSELIDDIGTNVSKYPVVFHNGHFSEFVDKSSYHSDTYNFVNEFFKFKDVNGLLKNNKEGFLQIFDDVIKTNKLAVMYPNSSIETVFVGDFKTENGYLFSNDSYKSNEIINNDLITTYDKVVEAKVVNFERKRKNKTIRNIYSENFDQNLFNIETDYEIKLTNDNFHELELKANCVISTNNINLNDVCFLQTYNSKDNIHGVTTVFNNELNWLTTHILEKCFTIQPNEEFIDKYRDIEFLHSTIVPTRSSIKKILTKYNKLVNKKKKIDYTISLKYGNSILKNIRLDAIKEFVEIHCDLLNSPLNVSQF